MAKKEFTWVDTYKELVQWLRTKEHDQEGLITVLQMAGVTNFNDRDFDNSVISLKEIDPFTFLCYLNKYGNVKRLEILSNLTDILGLTSNKPTDVEGLPTINAMKVWLFGYKNARKDDDIKTLWTLFYQAIDHNIEEAVFQKSLGIRCVGKGKLSICLFYTDPDFYLPLDTRTSLYLKNERLDYSYNTYNEYGKLIRGAEHKLKLPNCEISQKAWLWSQSTKIIPKEQNIEEREELFGERFRIDKLASLIDFIEEVIDKSEFQGEVYYRGQASTRFELEPRIYTNPNHTINEDVMLKELIAKMPSEFQMCISTFERMVKMQHYGLPTRLLDITSNPLVALYFACKEFHDKEDGRLYRFEVDNKDIRYYDSDTVSVISNIARRPYGFSIDKSKYTPNGSMSHKDRQRQKAEFNGSDEIVYLLHEIGAEKPHFKPLIDIEDLSRTICVKPKLDNPRIIRQDGAFFLFGIDGDKAKCALSPEPSQIFIIPKNKKKDILTQLEALGINEFSLFPDIDHSARHIKERFAKEQA